MATRGSRVELGVRAGAVVVSIRRAYEVRTDEQGSPVDIMAGAGRRHDVAVVEHGEIVKRCAFVGVGPTSVAGT